MARERYPVCGRYKKDPESLTSRQRFAWMRTGRYHGHGEASHGDELEEEL